jgi:ATP-dependent Lon protease
MSSRKVSPKTSSKKKPQPLIVPAVPMRGMVSFPFMVLPLFIGRDKSVRALEAASETDKHLLLISQRDESVEEPQGSDLYDFGTLAEVMQILKMPDGNVRVVVEGRRRVRVAEYLQEEPYFTARVEPVEELVAEQSPAVEALVRRLKTDFESAVNLSKSIPPEALQNAQGMDEPGPIADLVVSYLEIALGERQAVLETLDPTERARKASELLQHELQVLELDKELDVQVREGVGESQREYFLRERLKAIQEKLGDRDSSFKEADNLRTRIAEANMTDEASEKALSEVDRMEKMPSIAPEVGVIRSYVELMCDLPWNTSTPDRIDLLHAQSVLDEDHYALEKIKDRILEFLAVRKLNPGSKGPILCFAGPPGVGKTSIGKSIARSLGREFIRVSVGGIHDEAEIRGHRRTYIGSMPGRIISALRRVKVKNPVFLLDEIDKIGSDFRGDPSSALLEALDPEQNGTFSDHYLEVPFDLSQVMFIATANQLDPIPPALRDRLEVLRFPGYTEAEKFAIATRYLLPKQMKENGITANNIEFTPDGVTTIIRNYTREAGVRNLEREIGTVCRKVARKVAETMPDTEAVNSAAQADSAGKAIAGKTDAPAIETPVKRGKKNGVALSPVEPIVAITEQTLPIYLGPRKFIWGAAQEIDEIGVAQGLAWTEVGGELLPIEISLVDGKGNTKLTGNLGNVMKESCEAAMTYARSHADKLGITGDWTKKHDAHIHVPSGAVPKDGPSAGVAIACALVSALTLVAMRRDVAMTGEISLRGRVMPVGGVKEKILAAHRAGIKTILLPYENERDLDDIPVEVRQDMTFHLLRSLDEAIPLALVDTRNIALDAKPKTVRGPKAKAISKVQIPVAH